VTTDPLDAASEAICELARMWDTPVTLEVWGADGPLAQAGDHREQLAAALESPTVDRLDVPVAFAETSILVEVAGDVIAWPR
jgi:hypothetical protein